jgi:hypothetical protein
MLAQRLESLSAAGVSGIDKRNNVLNLPELIGDIGRLGGRLFKRLWMRTLTSADAFLL